GGGLTNGGFESGLAAWTSSGTTSVSSSGHTGSAAMVGSTSPTSGDSSVAQTFTAPSTGGSLTFWYKVVCPDSLTYDWATATLKDNTTGAAAVTVLVKVCSNTGAWQQSAAQTLTASHSYTLTLISHDDNYASDPTYTLYDDVTIGSGPPAPPPNPVQNPGFETGSLSSWTASGTTAVA